MAGRFITLKYAGNCADCGAHLDVGTRAKWYGRGRVYGLDCHDRDSSMSRGAAMSTPFANPGGKSALRAGPRRYPCPTCGREDMLSAADMRLGYQCDRCADIDEGSLAYEY